MLFSPLRRFALFAFAFFVLIQVTGCAVVSRQRTLPPSVRTIHIPMFVNRSAEPMIEERATILTQKQFLADGRLDLAKESSADAFVEVAITGFDRETTSFDADDFPRRARYAIEVDVRIVQNLPGRPVIGGVRDVRATTMSTVDKRVITYEPEPDAIDELLERLARQIVREVITGTYADGA